MPTAGPQGKAGAESWAQAKTQIGKEKFNERDGPERIQSAPSLTPFALPQAVRVPVRQARPAEQAKPGGAERNRTAGLLIANGKDPAREAREQVRGTCERVRTPRA